jgi:hypothetical protein
MKKILILAGNYKEFKKCVAKKKLDIRDCVFGIRKEMILGCDFKKIITYGSCRRIEELEKIVSYLKTRKNTKKLLGKLDL